METIIFSIPTFHWTNNPNMIKMKWKISHCGNIQFIMKDINNFLMNNYIFFTIVFTLFYLSCVQSHNSHTLLYLNDLNPLIENLYMFWCTWNLILWREPGNKTSSCFYDSKSGAFIPGQSSQEFKIQSHFGSFDPAIREEQWCDDASSQDIRRMC